jgi:hypothetical protein
VVGRHRRTLAQPAVRSLKIAIVASVAAFSASYSVDVGFVATNRNGEMERDPSPERIDDLVRELDGPEDDEHPDVSVDHESGWSLSAFPSGLVILGNAEESALNEEWRASLAISFGSSSTRWLAGTSRSLRAS